MPGQLLQLLTDASSQTSALDSSTLIDQLAYTLGWADNTATIEGVSRNPLPGRLLRTSIASEPAMLLLAHDEPDMAAVIPKLAAFAYHSSVEWGLAANSRQLVVFNSHWAIGDRWFTLPAISTSAMPSYEGVLSALSPPSLRDGTIERLAYQIQRPDHILVPVDDRLVDTLDRWRDEAMRYAKHTTAVDEHLQRLFSQLFVLRAVEDRGLALDVPPLRDSLRGHDDVDAAFLRTVFTSAQTEIQSELFDTPAFDQFPHFVVAGIIHDLYQPRDFPVSNVSYNFSWIDADVLGRAYEKYLSSVLAHRAVKERQLRFFDQPKRDVSRISVRKLSGVYYTPAFLVKFLVTKALDEYYSTRPIDSGALPCVADIACGSGSFLVTVVDELIKRLRSTPDGNKCARRLVQERKLIGFDVDPRAVTLARLSVWLRLAEEPSPLPLPNLSTSIAAGDSLEPSTWEGFPSEIDIIVGNPPFVATGRIPNQDALAARFESATGRFDYAYLFVEQAVIHLRDQGILSLVVPNRVFTNLHATALRRIIAEGLALLSVVDFGSYEVFEGTTAYIGVLCGRKELAHDRRVRAIKVAGLPKRFAMFPLIVADRAEEDVHVNGVRGFSSRYSADGAPWSFLSHTDRSLRLAIESDSEHLQALASVFQGIKTGANDIFVLDVVAAGAVLSECRNGMGDLVALESDMLKPVIYGAEIRRYEELAPSRVLIYPYENGELIEEETLSQRAPCLYEYLREFESHLKDRRTVQTHSRAWYGLAWQRNQALMETRKLVIRDLATEPAFAADLSGGVYLVGGTGIVPQSDEFLESLWAYLNSSFAAWFLKTTAPGFRAGFLKFVPGAIARLPIPRPVWEAGPTREHLRSLALEVLMARRESDEQLSAQREADVDAVLSEIIGVNVSELR